MPTGSASSFLGLNLLDVLLGSLTDKERRAGNKLLTDSDKSFSNENSSFVVRFNILFSHDRLKTPVQEVLNLQGEYVIEFILLRFQDAEDVQPTQQGLTLKLAFLIMLFKSQ